jgi:hypothetical protein
MFAPAYFMQQEVVMNMDVCSCLFHVAGSEGGGGVGADRIRILARFLIRIV